MSTAVTSQKQYRIIGVTFILLSMVIIVFGYLNMHREKPQEGQLIVKAGDDVVGTITMEDIKKYPTVKKKLVINSTQGLTKHEFTGTPLVNVLNTFDPHLVEKYDKVLAKGVDSYMSAIDMEEILEEDNVYLVYADNDKPLKTKTGKDGAMRIIVLYDEFGQRFTNYLVELQLD